MTSATLGLYNLGSSPGASGFSAKIYHKIDASGATGNATQFGAPVGDVLVAGIGAISLGWFSTDVTSLLQADVTAGYQWSVFGVNHASLGGSDPYVSMSFSSAEGGGGLAPYLSVETTSVAPVPEPATMLLLGSGLAGMGWFGRKRIKKDSEA